MGLAKFPHPCACRRLYTWTSTALRRSLPAFTADSRAVTTTASNLEPVNERMRFMADMRHMHLIDPESDRVIEAPAIARANGAAKVPA